MTDRFDVVRNGGVFNLLTSALLLPILTVLCCCFSQSVFAAEASVTLPSSYQEKEDQKQGENQDQQKEEKLETKPAQKAEPKTEKSPSKFQTSNFLPQSTRAWVAVSSFKELEAAIKSTKFGELATNKQLQPVFENLKEQIVAWGDQQDQKFAISLDRLKVFGNGELCFAGVLNPQGQHAVVMIVDVSNQDDEVAKLMKETEAELSKRGATKETQDIHGISTAIWKFKEPKGIQKEKPPFLQSPPTGL